MKTQISANELQKALSQIAPLIPARTTEKYLTCCIIEALNGAISLLYNDGETIQRFPCAGMIENEGIVAVEFKIFSDYIKLCEDELLILEFNSESHILHLQAPSHGANFKWCMDLIEFPRVAEPQAWIEVALLDGKEFINAWNHCEKARGTGDRCPSLTGIQFNFSLGKVELVGCDAVRSNFALLFNHLPLVDRYSVVASTPRKAALKPFGNGQISLFLSDDLKVLKFQKGEDSLLIPAIQGYIYPDSHPYIPGVTTGHMEIKQKDLLKAIQQLKKINADCIQLAASQQVTLSALDIDKNELAIALDCQSTLPPCTIWVNPAFLLDAIPAPKKEQSVTIYVPLSDKPEPIYILSDNHTSLIMTREPQTAPTTPASAMPAEESTDSDPAFHYIEPTEATNPAAPEFTPIPIDRALIPIHSRPSLGAFQKALAIGAIVAAMQLSMMAIPMR